VDEVANRGEPEAGDGDVLLAVLLHQRHDHLRRRTEKQVSKLGPLGDGKQQARMQATVAQQ
jgi:hypothetical protein